MAECRVCKKQLNLKEDDWIQPSKTYYFHRKCYKDWKNKEHKNDEDYIPLIYDYIARDLKVSYDWWACEAQRKKFIKEFDMTNKGILFALKYFYDVKHGDWDRGHGTIGIVPFIYQDSCKYWAARERKTKGIIAKIEQQIGEATNRKKKTVLKQESKSNKFAVNFNELDNLEDEE